MKSIAAKAAYIVYQRQKIVMLNDPRYSYIGLTSGGIGHSSLTLIRDDDILYCVFDWPNAQLSDAMSPGEVSFNADLLAEYHRVASDYQVAISEYIMECHLADANPDTVVYCGWGWGGALSAMVSTIVPPDYCIEFAIKHEAFSHDALTYLDEKCPSNRTGLLPFHNQISKKQYAIRLGEVA